MTREIRLSDYLHLLRRQWWVIAATVVATTTVGVLVAASRAEVYTASASVRLLADPSERAADDPDLAEADRTRELVTEVEVFTSTSLRDRVSAQLGATPPRFQGVRARLLPFSEVIVVSVDAPSAREAATVADAYVDTFIEVRGERAASTVRAQLEAVQASAEAHAAQIRDIDQQLADPALPTPAADGLRSGRELAVAQLQGLTARAVELEAAAGVTGQITERVSDASVPTQPASRDVNRSAVAGFVLGLLGGLGLAVLRDLVRDRLSGPEEVELIDPGTRVLATVPHMRRDAGGAVVVTPGAEEAYRYLRTMVQLAAADGAAEVIAVTSALGGEGTSTTALHLARAAAAAGRRVAVVDCDLRRPSLHEQAGVDATPGVASVVAGEASLEDAITYLGPDLAVVPAGAPTRSAPEVLGNERFASLVQSIASQADLTVLDLPPVLPVADALGLGGVVDGVVVVARAGRVRRGEVRTTLRRLRDARMPVLGVVVNDLRSLPSQHGGASPYVGDPEVSPAPR